MPDAPIPVRDRVETILNTPAATSATDQLMVLIEDLIRQAFRRGHRVGYDAGYANGVSTYDC